MLLIQSFLYIIEGGFVKSIIVTCILLPAVLFAAKLDVGVNAGMHRVSSDLVADFYGQHQLPMYGFSVVFRPVHGFWGIYGRYAGYRVTVEDEFARHPYHFSKNIVVAGLQVNVITVGDIKVFVRLGAAKHKDDLDSFGGKDRLGVNAGLLLQQSIGKKLSLNTELMYDSENVTVANYVNCCYSRHQAYLAGKSFDTGGLSILAGISYELNMPFKK